MSDRSRRKSLAVLAVVLMVGIVGSCLFLRKAQERKEFVSQTASGYRCRFMISPNWNSEVYPEGPNTVAGAKFTSRPNTIQRWIETHLFHQKTTPQSLPTIDLRIPHANDLRFNFRLQAGYPELPGVSTLRNFTHHHFRIDGYPATVITASSYDNSVHGTILLVYIPDTSAAYMVDGYASPSHSAQIDHEMQAIISSFHVEEVAMLGD